MAITDAFGEAVGFVKSNGGEASIPVGVNTVTYEVSDSCYNQNLLACQINVTVRDNTEPVAICEQDMVVSISTNSNTFIRKWNI